MSAALQAILDRAAHTARAVVVLDLDSTLFDTGERHRRLLVEFTAAAGDPALHEWACTLGPSDFGWSVLDPLLRDGVGDAALHKAIGRHWARGFFSDRFADVDLPVRGAVTYCRALAGAGALCVYLTGRDAPNMGAGTLRLLHRAGLPLLDGHGLALLKPSTSAGDAEHKRDALTRVAALGTVVGTFENEPGHANTFAEAFPDAVHVLVGDVHSPDAPAPSPAVVAVPDFRGPWEAVSG